MEGLSTGHLLAVLALIITLVSAVPSLKNYYLLHVAVLLICVALLVPR